MHIYGKKDPFVESCRLEPTVYIKNPKVIEHEEGHKLIHKFSDPDRDKILTDFIERQYQLKQERPKL